RRAAARAASLLGTRQRDPDASRVGLPARLLRARLRDLPRQPGALSRRPAARQRRRQAPRLRTCLTFAPLRTRLSLTAFGECDRLAACPDLRSPSPPSRPCSPSALLM